MSETGGNDNAASQERRMTSHPGLLSFRLTYIGVSAAMLQSFEVHQGAAVETTWW